MDLLPKLAKLNPQLIRTAVVLHRSNQIPVDTYVIDLDMVRTNAHAIASSGNRSGLTSYMCTKQFGRNPLVCRAIMNSGIKKAMAMDIEGVKALHRYGIPIAHVGHFGQIPTGEVDYVLEKVNPEYVTVYSVEKAKQISDAAKKAGRIQNVFIKVIDQENTEIPAHTGGFEEKDAISFGKMISKFPGIKVAGVTSYPAFYFSLKTKEHIVSRPFEKMVRVARELRRESIDAREINAAGRNCAENNEVAAASGATQVEPGQSFTGTLPHMALLDDTPELPAIAYVTEISHMRGKIALAYGDSYMPTAVFGSLKSDIHHEYLTACVGDDPDKAVENKVLARRQEYFHDDATWFTYVNLLPESVEKLSVGDSVVFGFRPQIYRISSRGRVAVVDGIRSGKPRLLGLFDRGGTLITRENEDPVGIDYQAVRKLMDSV